MSGILKYRLPGKSIVERSGNFIESPSIELKDAFVCSTFAQDKAWQFEDSDENESYFYGETPFCIEIDAYLLEAQQIIDKLKENEFQKIVYSRIKEVDFPLSDPNNFFRQLCHDYPAAFVYLISSPQFGTWIGASPEVLLKKEKNSFHTMALAGTRKTNDIPWTEKERIEQEFVSSYIEEALVEFAAESLEISDVYERNAGPVKHLCTDFNFTMKEEKIGSFLKELHPTSAVAGIPKQVAVDFIKKTERHDRNLYAGIIGISENNETNLFVNLRCCRIVNDKLYLYLGGGFTKDSTPESEWQETENKAQTLLRSLKKSLEQNPAD